MKRGFLTTSRYSPGNMMPESLETLFVGREAILNTVLKRIASSAMGPEKHYFLLVGPRGSGKTHLVALAYHRLTSRPEYADARRHLRIAYLCEEEWGIASYLDLLLRILQSLATCDGGSALAGCLEDVYVRYDRDPEDAQRFCEQLLIEHVGEDTLLLMCENLAELFQGLGEEGQQRWRAFIQQHPFWTILATTPGLFAGVQMREFPFYGFFTLRHLKRLDFEGALELLRKKAEHHGKPELAQSLRTAVGRARARAIHHLAGGNHRVYVMLFDFLDRESLDELVTPFLHMVDDLTPYYQDRMRQLAPRQRKIVEFLCHQAHPTTVKDIATRCLMSEQTAAKQIGELAKLGFVRRTPIGRKTFCELAEPLMRICIEVKDNRTEHLRLFVEFLRHWFSARELAARAAVEGEGVVCTCDRLHISAALDEYARDCREPFLDALTSEGYRCLRQGDIAGALDATERLVRDRGYAEDYEHYVESLRASARDAEALLTVRQAVGQHPTSAGLWHALALCLLKSHDPEAVNAIEHALSLSPTEPEYLCARSRILLRFKRFADALEGVNRLLACDPQHSCAFRIRAEALFELGRFDEAETSARQYLSTDPESIAVWVLLTDIRLAQSQFSEALKAVEKVCALDPSSWQPALERARVLMSLERWQQALDEIAHAAQLGAPTEQVSCLRSTCLVAAEQYEQALVACDEVLRADPQHAHAYLEKARALVGLRQTVDAVALLRGLGTIAAAHCDTLVCAAEMLIQLGASDDALQLTEVAARTAPESSAVWLVQAEALVSLSRYDPALSALARAQETGAASKACALVRSCAEAGKYTLEAGGRSLGAVLSANSETVPPDYLAQTVATMLQIELGKHGPMALARQLSTLRDSLRALEKRPTWNSVLVDFVRSCVRRGGLNTDEWASAIPLIREKFQDLKDCQIALNLLSVAARYARSGDKTVLLELPLEQRELLDMVPAEDQSLPNAHTVPGAKSSE